MLIYNNSIYHFPILEPSITIPTLYEDKDIDLIFSEFIKDELVSKDFSILFIPFFLSENPIELLGLRLAYHIRLSDILGEKRNVPIVLFGDLNPYAINKLSSLGEILFTEGIHYSKEENINELLARHQSQPLSRLINRQKFIERIRIDAPANYALSHHGITNEWAIARIAKAMGKESELATSIAFQNTQSLLHYKYLREKYPSSEIAPFAFSISSTKPTHILYIDDEYKKGWKDLLEKVFLPSRKFNIDTLEEDFKEMEQDNIITKAVEKIANHPQYDIILLDLRLHDSDFQENIKEMTGYKILQEIRKMDNAISKGISVIIFTASNKAWNYQTLIDIGADGYFIKESPENSIDANYTHENLKQFNETLKKAIEKAHLLKPYWELITKTKNSLRIVNKPNTQIKERIEERLDMFFGLLKKGFERSSFEKELFHYSDYELAFLTLWSVFNEVQEAYFETINIYRDWDWKMIDSEKEAYFLRANKSTLKYDRRNAPFYTISDPTYDKEATLKIDTQISYILLQNSLFDSKKSFVSGYLTHLHEVKDMRNKLYLTHGQEISSNFFEKTEKIKRILSPTTSNIHPQQGGDIEKLLNLVAFVLTGKTDKIIW